MKTIDAFKLNEEELKQEIRNNQDIEVDNCLGQRYLGCALKEGNIKLVGTPGNGLAAYLDGASIYVKGNAQDAVADTMNGGLVAIEGNAGYACNGHKKAGEEVSVQSLFQKKMRSKACQKGGRADNEADVRGIGQSEGRVLEAEIDRDPACTCAKKEQLFLPSAPVAKDLRLHAVHDRKGQHKAEEEHLKGR